MAGLDPAIQEQAGWFAGLAWMAASVGGHDVARTAPPLDFDTYETAGAYRLPNSRSMSESFKAT
jgi:hypothetical protein